MESHLNHDYARIRVGVHVTEHMGDDVHFVLSRFNSSEMKVLKEEIIPKIRELVADFAVGEREETIYTIQS